MTARLYGENGRQSQFRARPGRVGQGMCGSVRGSVRGQYPRTRSERK